MKIHKECQIEKCVSDDPGRWILGHVHLREIKGKPVVAASNGWALAVVPVEAEPKEYGLLTPEALKLARKGKPRERADITCNGSLVVAGKELDRPEGDYPDVTRVIPEMDGYKAAIAIDAECLLSIQKAMGSGGVVLYIKDELSPLMVKPTRNKGIVPEPEAFGVLMPVRMS